MDGSSAPLTERPDWVADAVAYQIFPDRFARTANAESQGLNLEEWNAPPTPHGYKGGDLLGIEQKLEWISALGVNVLYLNPIFQSGANHRYHTHDYHRIDPLLGGEHAFRSLLDAAHRRGIRVILDAVFNHTGRGFFPFHDLLENGLHSPWRDWFHVREFPINAYDPAEEPSYEAWWGLHPLPKLNSDNPAVRDYLMGVAERWTRESIDGWRLDVPNEIETPGFWEEFRRRVRAINPEAWIVGEIWTEAEAWIGDGLRFDGVMNYPLAGAILAYTAKERIAPELVEKVPYPVRPALDARGFAGKVNDLHRRYPWAAQLNNMNLLGSHDTPRLRSVAADDLDVVKMAYTLMFTLPGVPCVYYGDEIGLPGGHDPDCRRAFPWDQVETWEHALLDFLRQLARLRHEHRALRRGELHVLTPQDEHAEWPAELYLHVRLDSDRMVLTAVNAGGDPAEIELPALFRTDDEGWKTLLGAGEIGEGERLSLPPRSSCVLAARGQRIEG